MKRVDRPYHRDQCIPYWGTCGHPSHRWPTVNNGILRSSNALVADKRICSICSLIEALLRYSMEEGHRLLADNNHNRIQIINRVAGKNSCICRIIAHQGFIGAKMSRTLDGLMTFAFEGFTWTPSRPKDLALNHFDTSLAVWCSFWSPAGLECWL